MIGSVACKKFRGSWLQILGNPNSWVSQCEQWK